MTMIINQDENIDICSRVRTKQSKEAGTRSENNFFRHASMIER